MIIILAVIATKPEKQFDTTSLPGGSWCDSARRIRVVGADNGNNDSSWILKAELRTNKNWLLFRPWYRSAETHFHSGDLFRNDEGQFVPEIEKPWCFWGCEESKIEESKIEMNILETLAFMIPPFGLMLVRKTNKTIRNIRKTILSPFNHFFVISQGIHLKNALKLCQNDLAVTKAELKIMKKYRNKIEKDALKFCQKELAETKAELKMMMKYLKKIEKEENTELAKLKHEVIKMKIEKAWLTIQNVVLRFPKLIVRFI
jgi:hypothetical protein